MMKHFRSFSLLALAVVMASCATLEQGIVVSKGSRVPLVGSTEAPIYWVDVRGKNAEGEMATQRLELFPQEWKKVRKGDQIFPQDYNPILSEKAWGPRFAAMSKKHPVAEPPAGRKSGAKPTGPKPAAVAKRRESTPPARVKRTALPAPASSTPNPAVAARKEPPRPAPEIPAATPRPTPPAPAATPRVMTPAEREERFRAVEAQALEDPAVRALKQKIRTSTNDQDQAKAYREYRAGVLNKMRSIDGSLGDLIDKAQAANP